MCDTQFAALDQFRHGVREAVHASAVHVEVFLLVEQDEHRLHACNVDGASGFRSVAAKAFELVRTQSRHFGYSLVRSVGIDK